jgi:hypothetical protein
MTEQPQVPEHTDPRLAPARKALAFDAQEFCHYLADCDWTEEQKVEFILALWEIILSFVDLGFDLHPVQRVIDAPSTLELDSSGVLDSPNKKHFETTYAGFNHLVVAGRPDS